MINGIELPEIFFKEILLATEAVSMGAEKEILITGFRSTLKKLFPLSAILSFAFMEEIKKLPAGGEGSVGSVFFEQLKEKKQAINKR